MLKARNIAKLEKRVFYETSNTNIESHTFGGFVPSSLFEINKLNNIFNPRFEISTSISKNLKIKDYIFTTISSGMVFPLVFGYHYFKEKKAKQKVDAISKDLIFKISKVQETADVDDVQLSLGGPCCSISKSVFYNEISFYLKNLKERNVKNTEEQLLSIFEDYSKYESELKKVKRHNELKKGSLFSVLFFMLFLGGNNALNNALNNNFNKLKYTNIQNQRYNIICNAELFPTTPKSNKIPLAYKVLATITSPIIYERIKDSGEKEFSYNKAVLSCNLNSNFFEDYSFTFNGSFPLGEESNVFTDKDEAMKHFNPIVETLIDQKLEEILIKEK